MNAFDTDLPSQVEEWDAEGNCALRILAKCVSLEIATYVYEAALKEQTEKTRVLILRDRIKLIRDSRGE
jgi:hypothetical protein